ncbi:G-protein coupled receptor GRL101-like [Littorina saxatilis]|uniref:G-protein coupled receptor GRL101-like n=1 Tax=Littorina saxatilis TaxID=31220 RepID=UPI0038B6651B
MESSPLGCSEKNSFFVRDSVDALKIEDCTEWFYTFISSNNRLEIVMVLEEPRHLADLTFDVRVFDLALEMGNITANMGFIQTPGYSSGKHYPPGMDSWKKISVPLYHVTLVSSLRTHYNDCNRTHHDFLELYKEGNSTDNLVWQACGSDIPLHEVYNAGVLYVRFVSDASAESSGFKLLFSFHKVSRQPSRVNGGLWNCTVAEWPAFADHFRCNVERECEGGEDEADCFYTGHCGQGYLTLDDSTGSQRVPYSLVCDHRQQCADSSDETFCVFAPCSGSDPLQCATSNQCVPQSALCNGQHDCLDGSDEDQCHFFIQSNIRTPPPPSLVNFIPLSAAWKDQFPFLITPLPQSVDANSSSSPCPETHFQCADNGYCLPLFLLCNGVNDCPGIEDEEGCERVTCRGLYRCRASSVCVHPTHVCDGVYQCPQHDDELFCDIACPPGCTCHGLSVACHAPFPADLLHPDIRYLDASGSGLTPSRVTEHNLLIHLSVSSCGLQSVGNLTFPNLRSLDLSHNRLYDVSADLLRGMLNLQHLFLSKNPLQSLFDSHSQGLSFPAVRTLRVSGVKMPTLNTEMLSIFPGLLTLNLSHCGVDDVTGQVLHTLPSLQVLDLVGCPMTYFPRDLLFGLDRLQSVAADNYKLCCQATLPPGFNLANCRAPFDEVSSCESLLRSDLYRVCLSIFAALALLGNLGCFVVRTLCLKSSKSGFSVFVTHLSLSDFLMGVYLAVIGVADRLYRDEYLWEDVGWRHSAGCGVAGYLSLMSNEVSAFIICLITLDRFLALRFPLSTLRFNTRSAHLTCTAVWLVAMVMAAVPLLPVTSHWSFYRSTGICIPLPVTRGEFPGQKYAFGVIIVLNFILFMLIAIGQASIYAAITANSMDSVAVTDTSRKSADMRIARRLFSVALSDFLCWFPIGLLGLLAARGVAIPGEVSVGLAILVLPLNSALNPFLYTINMLLERRGRGRDERLLKQVLAQIAEEGESTG